MLYEYKTTNTILFDGAAKTGFVTEDECFPLLFQDGKLVGWGNEFYTEYRLKRRDKMPEVKLPDDDLVENGADLLS